MSRLYYIIAHFDEDILTSYIDVEGPECQAQLSKSEPDALGNPCSDGPFLCLACVEALVRFRPTVDGDFEVLHILDESAGIFGVYDWRRAIVFDCTWSDSEVIYVR